MTFKVIIFAEANTDIREAATWYDEQQKGLGKRFIQAVKKEITIIRQNPLLYNIRYDNVRTALIETFPYLIHFDVNNHTIFIKAIYHTSRNNDIWMER